MTGLRAGIPVAIAISGAGQGLAGLGRAWQGLNEQRGYWRLIQWQHESALPQSAFMFFKVAKHDAAHGRKSTPQRLNTGAIMEIIKLKITGTRALIMHADTFANPLSKLTKAHKELTSKRKKTDEDHEAIARSEWEGGMYFDKELGPYLPGINIEAALIAGGKLSKLGTQLKRSVEVMEEMCPLQYDGPRDMNGLWDAGFYDARSVKVQTARLMRYRPKFTKWSAECTVMFDPETINREQVVKCLEDGGAYCGVGDFRPKYGRFSVEVIK